MTKKELFDKWLIKNGFDPKDKSDINLMLWFAFSGGFDTALDVEIQPGEEK